MSEGENATMPRNEGTCPKCGEAMIAKDEKKKDALTYITLCPCCGYEEMVVFIE